MCQGVSKSGSPTPREMPPSMEFLLGASAFASWAWWLIPLLLFISFVGLTRYFGKDGFRRIIAAFLLKLPLLGKIIADLEMCKYIRTLAILIGNHVEIIRTMKIAGKIINNPVIAATFEDIGKKLKGGAKLSAALNMAILIKRSRHDAADSPGRGFS